MSARATLSRAVDHVPCARAIPNAAPIVIKATATCSVHRKPPVCVRARNGTVAAEAHGKRRQAGMVDVTSRRGLRLTGAMRESDGRGSTGSSD